MEVATQVLSGETDDIGTHPDQVAATDQLAGVVELVHHRTQPATHAVAHDRRADLLGDGVGDPSTGTVRVGRRRVDDPDRTGPAANT